MLKELARLSVEAEGQYATDADLKFLEDYLETVDTRFSAYKKIRDAQEKIVERVETQKRQMSKNLSSLEGRDITSVCNRDMAVILRYALSSMLLNDMDYLRDGILIWYQTIVRAYKYTDHDQSIYEILQKVVQTYLTPEESDIVIPVLQVTHTLVS